MEMILEIIAITIPLWLIVYILMDILNQIKKK